MAFLVLASCKKENDTLLFEESAEKRMSIKLDELSDVLTSAEHGWIGNLTVVKTGGYGFYFDFDKNQKVKMYADLNKTTATKVGESSYRLKAVSAPSLIFDTYNYITLLQDPEPSAYGGDAGKGYQSDIEFEYRRSTPDSVFFVGKKYRQDFILVKATVAQKAQFTNGEYETEIDRISQFFVQNDNPFVELKDGSYISKVQLSINKTDKKVELTGILEDGEVTSSQAKFYYGLEGIYISGEGLLYENVLFKKFVWSKSNTLIGYDDKGDQYELANSVQPIVPLYKLMGVKYSSFFSAFRTIYPGTSEPGKALLNTFHENLLNAKSGYTFNYGTLNFRWNIVNQRMELEAFHSQNGGTSGWTTKIVYDYTATNDGVYTFVLRTAATGGYTAPLLVDLNKFFLNNKIKFDYFVDGTSLYGKMISLDNPAIEMTFILR